MHRLKTLERYGVEYAVYDSPLPLNIIYNNTPVLVRFSPLVEPLSIDEGFLDITGMERFVQGNPRNYGLKLKKTILTETGLVASVGIAPNKFLAKLASDLEKPDGLVVIRKEDIQSILWPLPISRIWGGQENRGKAGCFWVQVHRRYCQGWNRYIAKAGRRKTGTAPCGTGKWQG
ncbi:hypothetical protein [Selenomonas sp.]|uniref:DNA polymerase Y family protein n=1 Tax=Selenomonas sp. TaxID=2053611 RepID=UPI0025D16A11|nr:hypothetical protein [Selenomonas sp.]